MRKGAILVTLVCTFSILLFGAEVFAQKQWLCPTQDTCPGGYSFISGANWALCYRTDAPQQGTIIHRACFQGRTVLFEGSQPFVLVPYHGDPPNPTFKDGLGPRCGGIGLTPLSPPQAVVGPDDDNPGYQRVQIARTYQIDWYEYRQRWVFHGNGAVDAELGLGGFLARPPFDPLFMVPHFHSPYWRLDFDVANITPNFVEEFFHTDLRTSDVRGLIATEGKLIGSSINFVKWRVRSDQMNTQGEFRSYDIETTLGQQHEFTTGDIWAVRFRGSENGEIVGMADCSDLELDEVYARDPAIPKMPESIDGEDVVIWASATKHHEPRHLGEERGPPPRRMPGFEWIGIKLTPRNFTDGTPSP